LGQCPVPHFVQHVDELWIPLTNRIRILWSLVRTFILLPKDFCKLNSPLNRLFPSSGFESEAHRLASFADRRQLEEIASNDKLRDSVNIKDQ
jgi:hypothetical protein